ncbi:fungal-specific transcription factor domain-containing protein [Lentinula aciculospora]|uniref:Fungal-specific transcription factor domain-containing protein n=1 Tax=Lentinula aciculospora TaxID=153920 RepID=A0A9W9DY06_9AGAR|nr:fungal-specific transcription factor domain-containing protein [Lentinula aciculospora]
MPAIANSVKAPSRRKEKHLSPEELKDIEQKRLKGELSCAECRRLKLRCDKKLAAAASPYVVPCGILEAGVGTRFILASTNQLHSKISLMSSRIRALEDALAIFQASVSSERHPLLEDELLKIKFGSEVKDSEENEMFGSQEEVSSGATSINRSVDTTTLDAFGTLTLGEEGEMKYFGRSAGSETLILAGEKYVDSDEEEPDPRHSQSRSDLRSSSEATSFAPTSTAPSHMRFFNEDADAVPPEVYALALDYNQGVQMQSPPTFSDLLKHLPPRLRAAVLAQAYIDHASLFFRAIKKDELFDTVLPLLYSSSTSPSFVSSSSVPIMTRDSDDSQTSMSTDSEGSNSRNLPSPHLLSVIFFVFALGSFFDLSVSIETYVSESQMWFDLGRQALTCSRGTFVQPKNFNGNDIHLQKRRLPYTSAGTNPTSTFVAPPSTAEDTIRALGLMATYCSLSGKKHARDSAWCGMSLAAKVAQGSGMHRDPARWHMDPVTVQRRRALWWEVCTSDISHSVALGRPPSIHLSFVDCEFPTDEEATLSDTGEEVMGFWRMKYTFARESFTPVISTTLSAKSPTYTTIMDLDRKIRELSLPPGFKPYVSLYEDGPDIYHNSHLSLRDFYASQHRTVTMLYLHRSFFAHAMLTHPSNPLMSPFALSFLAAYRAASVIIKAAVHFYDRCPAVVPRVWFLTYHVFSAAMTVGTVVKRSPNSSISKSALNDLGQALSLFEKCASSSPRNRIAYALLRRLKEKADRAYTGYLAKFKDCASPSISAKTTPANVTSLSSTSLRETENAQEELNPSLFSRTPVGADDNELAIWGGKTSLLDGLGKKRVRGKGASNTINLGSNVDSPGLTLLPSTSTSSTAVPFSSRREGDVSSTHLNFLNGSLLPPASFHSETFWDDAMDAQMNFDANIDLASIFPPATDLPQTSSIETSAGMDVNMTDASLSNFGNVDFGFKLRDGFGAGTTGSRGLLMDMALEDIGHVDHVLGSSTTSHDPPRHSISPTSQVTEPEQHQMLMEYLSETANQTSVPLPFGGFHGSYSGTNASLPWANSNTEHFYTISESNGTDVAESGIKEHEFDSGTTELYTRFLNYLASKEEYGTQNSDVSTTSMPLNSLSSIFPESADLGWTGAYSNPSSRGPSSSPSVEDYSMLFESLVGSRLDVGVSSPPESNRQGNSIGNYSSNFDSRLSWNTNDMGNASHPDPSWATLLRDLTKGTDTGDHRVY